MLLSRLQPGPAAAARPGALQVPDLAAAEGVAAFAEPMSAQYLHLAAHRSPVLDAEQPWLEPQGR